jgi:diketogulonate reductase-like aldo/keto reductase
MSAWSGINRRDAIRLIAGSATLMMTSSSADAAQHLTTRPIPSTGEELPVIGLGTWQTFDTGSADVLADFVNLGGKLIDSSPMYTGAESAIGQLASKLKLHDKLFMATKVWTSGREAGIEQMGSSMQQMRVKRLDLMQVHNLVDAATHLDTLAGWKRDGKVRYIGITHYTNGAHSEVMSYMRRYPVDFVQINYSVADRAAEQRLLPLAIDRKIAVIANRPFSTGDLFGRVRGKALPAWAKDIDADSWAQLFLKFIVSHPAVTVAIPATGKVTHMRDNMKAQYGRLPDAELRERIARAIS